MKIDLTSIDQTQFMVSSHEFDGELIYLIQSQHIGIKWTQKNKIFRSSVWNSDGELISAGFPKFTNWGENPEQFPVPTSLKDTVITEKIDGSLLVASKYKGKFIIRTRGTIDASKLDNGFEIEIFKDRFIDRIDKFMMWESTWNKSFLFEWVSPNQKIILNYGDEPDWYLVGVVVHHDYSLWTQQEVDGLARFKISAKRPPVYTFPTVEELMSNVEKFKGKEGVVVYSNHDETLHKVKGLWYLALHRMKESLSSIDKVIDVWFEQKCPDYLDFQDFIVKNFDWELWQQIQGEASKICGAWKEVEKILDSMVKIAKELSNPQSLYKTRKDQALYIQSHWGKTNRASMLFKLLDGKLLTVDDHKKLLYQCLKK